ncbi:MAG: hypothetical protein EHM72_10485 [Calditrichaeota bacterium]|nr:MAG: hypothetical protein EHM72_10485 [Calditrichota bacterium]
MDTKLTLKLDKVHIEQAKRYATKRKTSLSSLVEKYFAFLADANNEVEIEITPIVRKLSGVLHLESEFDIKDEKRNRLLEKYK